MPYRRTLQTERRKAAMRQRILQAGRTLFARQGYDNTTLQQIVREARTSVGNCYFYFRSKEALLFAIAGEFRAEIAEATKAATEPLPPGVERLAVGVYAGIVAVFEQPEIARFAFSDAGHPTLRPLTGLLFTQAIEKELHTIPGLFDGWYAASPKLGAVAWRAAADALIEEGLHGRLKESPQHIALFLARWNLQAIGLSQEQVQQGLIAIERYASGSTDKRPAIVS